MKHIKLFEEVNEYYKEIDIDGDEWEEFETLQISDLTISKINNLSPFLFETKGHRLEYWYHEEKNKRSGKSLPTDILFIIIYEGDDEYFYVHTSNLENHYYYKCDQLEGLKVLLNKIYLNEIF